MFSFLIVMHHLQLWRSVRKELLSRLHLQASVTRFVIQLSPSIDLVFCKNWQFRKPQRRKKNINSCQSRHQLKAVEERRTLTNLGLPTLAICLYLGQIDFTLYSFEAFDIIESLYLTLIVFQDILQLRIRIQVIDEILGFYLLFVQCTCARRYRSWRHGNHFRRSWT